MLGSLGNMGGVGSIVAVVGIAGLDKFEQDLGKMAKAVDGQAQFMHKSMTAAAAAGAVMFAASIKAASDFESSFAGVTKTIDGISDDFGNLNTEGKALAQKFRDLSLEIPISVNELNKIAEMGGALGVPKDDIEGFTKAIANLGTTTDLTTEAGAEAIAKFINVTTQVAPAGMSMAEQTERIGSTLVDLGNKTAATESAIASMATRVAGAGAQIGMSQADILSFSAALSSVGIEAEMGGSAISKLMIEISTQVETGGSKLDDFASVANLSVEQFSRLFRDDAASAMNAFFAGLNNIKASGESVFPTLKELGIEEVRLRDTILRASGASDLFAKSLEDGRKAFESNTAMAIEAQKRYETFAAQVQLAKNGLNDVFITIGQQLLPAMKLLVGGITEHKNVTAALATGLGVATLAIGAAAIGLKTYKTAAELAKLANVTLAGSLGPIAAVAAAIGVVTVAYGAMKDAQEKQTQKAVDQIGAMGKEVEQAESLGRTIEKLRGKKNLNITETINLRDAEEKYAAMLRSVGLDVTSFSGKIDEQTKAFKRLREQQLLKMREDLDAQLRDLAQTTGFVDFFSDAWGNFTNKMGGINKQIEAINTELNDLQGPVSLVTTGVTDLGNAASGDGGSGGASDKLKALAEQTEKAKEKFDDFYSDTLRDAKAGMAHWIDQISAAPREVDAVGTSFDHLKRPLDANISAMRGMTNQTHATMLAGNKLNPVLEEQKTAAERAAEAYEEAAEKARPYVSAIGSLLDQMSGGNQIVNTFASGIANVIQSGVSPLSLAMFGLNTVFSLFSKEEAPAVYMSVEEILESMGDLSDEMERLDELTQELGDSFKSSLLSSLDEYIDSLKEALEGTTEMDRILSDLTIGLAVSTKQWYLMAFELTSSFDAAAGGLEYLSETAIIFRDKFGSMNFGGLGDLLQEQIDNGRELLATLDPESKAYNELAQKVLYAEAALSVLKGEYESINGWIQDNITLIDTSSEVWKEWAEQFGQAINLPPLINPQTTAPGGNSAAGTYDPERAAQEEARKQWEKNQETLNNLGIKTTDQLRSQIKTWEALRNNLVKGSYEWNALNEKIEAGYKELSKYDKTAKEVTVVPEMYNGETKEYWIKVLEGIDAAYYKNYEATQARLETAKENLQKLRDESAQKLAEIDKDYAEKIAKKQAERDQIQHSLDVMLGERAEISTRMGLQTAELRGNATEITSFLNVLGQSRDLAVIRDLEDGVERITGKTRSFMLDWDAMLEKISGGSTSEYDQRKSEIESASAALEKAVYFGENIDGSEFEDQINGMLYSTQEFLKTLDPKSQAYKDASAALGALTTKFYQAGGTYDPAAAVANAKKWAEDTAAAMEAEAKKIEEEGNYQLLKLDLDITGVKEQLTAADGEIAALYKEWDEKKMEIQLDISQAEGAVETLRNQLKAMREDWYNSKVTLWFESEGAAGIPGYSSGGYIDRDQIALVHANEFVLNEDSVAAIGRGSLERFNASADPSALHRIDSANAKAAQNKSRDAGSAAGLSVVVHEATSKTWVEVTDKFVHPRVTKRDRKYKIANNPYAR